jgi:hypothetical protein
VVTAAAAGNPHCRKTAVAAVGAQTLQAVRQSRVVAGAAAGNPHCHGCKTAAAAVGAQTLQRRLVNLACLVGVVGLAHLVCVVNLACLVGLAHLV